MVFWYTLIAAIAIIVMEIIMIVVGLHYSRKIRFICLGVFLLFTIGILIILHKYTVL